ncbi:MAG: hypothetical protein KF856_12030 [Cyclobacteriaceae bacterium]|nr:hypothetical protein [Cyclobacteriaceae bacterium]
MKRAWFLLLIGLAVADAWLIAKPNLLGKLGFIIYKYHYLRTFPRALFTVALVMGTVLVLTEFLVWINQRQLLSRKAVLFFFKCHGSVVCIRVNKNRTRFSKLVVQPRRLQTKIWCIPVARYLNFNCGFRFHSCIQV